MDASKIPAGITDLDLREQAAALWDAYLAAESALENAPDGTDLEALDAARDAADQAYNDLPSPALACSYYAHPDKYRCSVCGIPVWDEDEFLEDSETGEIVLRAAIGLPPRPEQTEETDELDEEAA
jgi:hypothetical protein